MSRPEGPTVAHFKDHFLQKSETFIYTQLRCIKHYETIVLDRFAQENRDAFPFEAHYSPAERYGPTFGAVERLALRWLGRSPYLEHVLKSRNCVLLHAHFGQLGALIEPVASRLRLPLITSFYGKDAAVFAASPRWRGRFRRLWNLGAHFLVLGPTMAKNIVELGCPPEKTHVVPLALRLDSYEYRPRGIASGERPVRLFSVGRLVPKKGMDILLQALATLGEEEQFHLRIAGDGPQRSELESLVKELELVERVTFCGWLSHAEMIAQMDWADLFVLASRTDPASLDQEGTPSVLIEAQARGLPVVSTKHADIPFIVEDGVSGFLVSENSADELARALQRLVANPEMWHNMGEAGRRHVETNHSCGRVASMIEDIYGDVLRTE